ncbi:MAG: hypothetical protein JNL64_00185 [Blastocatellia bacterium]|nr:hypothetical protein [Blastocatellia bacterium]
MASCYIRLFPDPDQDQYKLLVHRVATDRLKDLEDKSATWCNHTLQAEILPIADEHFLSQIFWLLHSSDKAAGPDLAMFPRFSELLTATMKSERPSYPSSSLPENIESAFDIERSRKFLDPFRDVLEEVFKEISPGRPAHAKPDLGNVFCVIRTVQHKAKRLEAFPYTANLLLSSGQVTALGESCGSVCDREACPDGETTPAECLYSLETALGLNSRSAADVTFCSGIIDFGRRPNDLVWDRVDTSNPAEQRRVAMEKKIYPRSNPGEPSPSLYYVPVHVNGIPWLVLFIFTPADGKDDQKRWDDNLAFYRNATHKALAYLRWRAEEVYAEILAASAFDNVTAWSLDPSSAEKAINLAWDTASRVFPFPRVTIHRSHPDFVSEDVNCAPLPPIPGRGYWRIEMESDVSVWGARQVEWGRVDISVLFKKVTAKLADRIRSWEAVSRVEADRSVAYVSHLLLTPISEVMNAAESLPKSAKKKSVLSKLDGLREFGRFAMATVDPKKGAGLVGAMEVLGHNEFVDFLCGRCSVRLATLVEEHVSGDSDIRHIAVQWIANLESSKIDSKLNERMAVKYHPKQARIVVDEAIANAVLGTVGSDLVLSLSLVSDDKGWIWLQVINSTVLPPKELKRLIDSANGGSSDMLGVANLRAASRAINFPDPIWFVSDTSHFGIKAVVGSFREAAEDK